MAIDRRSLPGPAHCRRTAGRRGAGALTLALLLAAAGACTADTEGAAGKVLTGRHAFGDWQRSVPGTRRLIRPSDLPEPFATHSASNPPAVVTKPSDAAPRVPPGFRVTELAHGLDRPRVIRVAPDGDVFVADSGAGEIHVFRLDDHGRVARHTVFARGLDRPYGIAFYPPGPRPEYVYVGNTASVVRFPYKDGAMAAGGKAQTVVPELPTGGHWTRDLAFSPDGKTLYVAVGSASNVAAFTMDKTPPKGFVDDHPLGAAWGGERDRADVLAFTPEGKDRRIVATGMRNCSGLAVQPGTGALWCVVNERDGLGDNLPPDYAARVRAGAFYGWPWYYIGDHRDPRHADARPDLAGKVTVPDVLFQAHSAPLGIAFYDGDGFPAAYRGDAFVAMHGSWNRGRRTGYKVVRLIFDHGRATGVYEDFVTGFVLSARRVWGRPVGVAVAKDGALLLSEDGNGTLWRISAKE